MRPFGAWGVWISWIFILCYPLHGFPRGNISETARESGESRGQVEGRRGHTNGTDFTSAVGSPGGIAGGIRSALERNPWQAALFRKDRPNRAPFCGGSLIHIQYVLTAAHCMHGRNRSNVFVRMGEFDWTEKEKPMHDDYEIEEVIWYRDYEKKHMCYDIALLELTEEVQLWSHIRVIPLVEDDTGFEGKIARVSGWGRLGEKKPQPTRLRELDVEIVELPYISDVCHRHHYRILAGSEKGKGICSGDSGGPLSVEINGVRHLLGVAVRSYWGCSPGKYMRVSSFLKWIERTIR